MARFVIYARQIAHGLPSRMPLRAIRHSISLAGNGAASFARRSSVMGQLIKGLDVKAQGWPSTTLAHKTPVRAGLVIHKEARVVATARADRGLERWFRLLREDRDAGHGRPRT